MMALHINASGVLISVAWTTLLLWLAGAFFTWRGLIQQRPLAPVIDDDLTRNDAPLVSVLVPARNEERRVLEPSVRSMLAQDYARVEVIAVNDRSVDATGAILKSIAATDVRLRVIDGVEPPDGWLGKPHALQQALDAARGEWALATDADMIYERRALRTAMAYALESGFDAVTLLPRVDCLTFWERVFMPTFGWFMLMAMPIERVNDPRRPESLGVGGFFLMRRATLERVGGYRAVRDEVAEDLRMAEALKRAGARLRLEYAPDLLRTRMQENLRDIWDGFTKNLFAGAKFSLARGLAGAASVSLFAVAPFFVALLCMLMITRHAEGLWPRLLTPCVCVWLTQVLIFALINRRFGVPARYALTIPLGHALFVAILLNSIYKIASGRGVTWKGRTLYEQAGVRPPRSASTQPADHI